ncbi:YitT family protein [Thermoclostridium stercorarium]|uniref:YitT family protein n=1 Tax=Thermoclostridium stercorarium TaxID=1510 RepID=UPI001FA6C484|nr:YitT family protein [Thermoclostridium stercorarium]
MQRVLCVKFSHYKITSLLQIFFGSIILALAMNIFLIPYKIAPGGVSGIATVIYHVSGERIPVGFTMLAINIPLFLAAMKIKGRNFIIKSTLGAVFLSVIIDITEQGISRLRELVLASADYSSADILLFALAGGFASGIGLGFVFKEDATTGGTDMAASLLNKAFPWIPVGTLLMILDGLVILIATVVFKSFRLGLYSVVALYVSARTLDRFLEGLNYAKSLMIISRESEKIARALMENIDRGVTGIYGKGMYTDNPYMILLCVVKKEEIHRVKNEVKKIDPNAFVLLTDVREVLGEGFTSHHVS